MFTVGRLDKSSDGLILVTNDGQLANRLAHPRYAVPKTYRVEVAGHPPPQTLTQLRRGVHLAEGVARARKVRIRSRRKQSTLLEIELTEGRNREIRRMLARTGHKVLRLTRIALGPLRLGELPPGGSRRLTRGEVAAIERTAYRRNREKP
jgi:23S rRNA pseudouridine2605 synthase